MGVYAAMAGIGATVELLPGGVLTDALDWRWVFFINIPIGLAVSSPARNPSSRPSGPPAAWTYPEPSPAPAA